MSYVYIKSERAGQMGALHDLYTVGFYDPAGQFQPESDHAQESAAAARVRWLNGGRDAPASETVTPMRDTLQRVQQEYPAGISALERDAARYRWLRKDIARGDTDVGYLPQCLKYVASPDMMDAMVDEQIENERNGHG